MSREHTFYLFPLPSFWEGVSRIVDPFGSLNQQMEFESDAEADRFAIYCDWAAVGDDIRSVASQLQEEVVSQGVAKK